MLVLEIDVLLYNTMLFDKHNVSFASGLTKYELGSQQDEHRALDKSTRSRLLICDPNVNANSYNIHLSKR